MMSSLQPAFSQLVPPDLQDSSLSTALQSHPVELSSLVTSRRYRVAPTATVWPLFQRDSCMHHVVRRVVRVRRSGVEPVERRRLKGIPVSNYNAPRFDPLFGGRVWRTQGVENVDPTFLCDFYTQYRFILHPLAIIQTESNCRQIN